jgi:indole-3-glycerol phosphate synthase
MSILQEIVKNKKQELEHTKRIVSLSELQARITDSDQPRPFKDTITRKPGESIRIIAELKQASPSEGRIRQHFDINEIISVYDDKDVRAISVLTEQQYFQGSLNYLNLTQQLTQKPLLRKDFIFDNYQVYESRANKADAILLIVAILSKTQLSDLMGLSIELSLGCLVEIHSLKELDTALDTGAGTIGINNRDLNTLKTSLDTTRNLVKDIPKGKTIVSESGIHTRKDVEAIEATGADAILVGTTIMKAGDIGAKIDELLGHE